MVGQARILEHVHLQLSHVVPATKECSRVVVDPGRLQIQQGTAAVPCAASRLFHHQAQGAGFVDKPHMPARAQEESSVQQCLVEVGHKGGGAPGSIRVLGLPVAPRDSLDVAPQAGGPLPVSELVDGIRVASLRHPDAAVGEDKFPRAVVQGEAVHAVSEGQHNHGDRGVQDVPRCHLLPSWGERQRPEPFARAGGVLVQPVDAKDGAARKPRVEGLYPVEGVRGDNKLPALRHRLVLAAGAAVAPRVEPHLSGGHDGRLQRGVRGSNVLPRVRRARREPSMDAGGRKSLRDLLARGRYLCEERRKLRGLASSRAPLREETLQHRGARAPALQGAGDGLSGLSPQLRLDLVLDVLVDAIVHFAHGVAGAAQERAGPVAEPLHVGHHPVLPLLRRAADPLLRPPHGHLKRAADLLARPLPLKRGVVVPGGLARETCLLARDPNPAVVP
mmetsp:Transcript_37104/g.88206  ORF Transcript_37104/g.88206 Transcript_37104/m.88206 type:complete len:447 (-) Transcript_37104:1282-2622(-)